MFPGKRLVKGSQIQQRLVRESIAGIMEFPALFRLIAPGKKDRQKHDERYLQIMFMATVVSKS
jgi:hypothetical protein